MAKKDTIGVILTSYGEIRVLSMPVKLYKDSFKVVKLRCLVPFNETQDTSLVKVWATDTDERGDTIWSGQTYNLPYKTSQTIDNKKYDVYEDYLPEEFCATNGDKTLTFTRTFINAEGEASASVTTGNMNIYISGEGYNYTGVEVPKSDVLASQYNKIIAGLIEAMALKPYDATYSYTNNTITFTQVDGNILFYKSLQEDNLGNSLDDERYWKYVDLGRKEILFIRYAKDINGTDMTDRWSDGYDYIGFYVGETASTEARDYQWALFKGDKGEQGDRGLQGEQGDSIDSLRVEEKTATDEYIDYNIFYTVGEGAEQLAGSFRAYRGEKGEQGLKGDTGEKGDSITSLSTELAYTGSNYKEYDMYYTIGDGEKVKAGSFQTTKGDKGDKGEVGMVFKGEWNDSAYNKGDIVTYNGSSYIALQNIIAGSGAFPDTSEYSWSILAKAGEGGGTSINTLEITEAGTFYQFLRENFDKIISADIVFNQSVTVTSKVTTLGTSNTSEPGSITIGSGMTARLSQFRRDGNEYFFASCSLGTSTIANFEINSANVRVSFYGVGYPFNDTTTPLSVIGSTSTLFITSVGSAGIDATIRIRYYEGEGGAGSSGGDDANAHKQILLGADGVLEGDVYHFTVDNADSYLQYRTHLTKFLVDLHLPITGALDTTKEVTITFGDTSYYVFNILKGMERSTIGDLHQVDKYNNETGYRFIAEMTFFDTTDIKGFAIIPTISMSDVLSLDSDQMDNYLADGGLTDGQLAVCSKVITNGYEEGGLYRFDVTYPSTYAWTKMSNYVPDKTVFEDKTLRIKNLLATLTASIFHKETVAARLQLNHNYFFIGNQADIYGDTLFAGALEGNSNGMKLSSQYVTDTTTTTYIDNNIKQDVTGIELSSKLNGTDGNTVKLTENTFTLNGQSIATVNDIQTAIQNTWEASY